MSASNTREIRKELEQRWRGRTGEASGFRSAYEDQGGAPRDVQGDEEAPWHKAPPFTEDPQIWLRPTALASNAYLTLEGIDTKQYRLLAIYVTYLIPQAQVPPAGVGQLSIVPEMRSIDPLTRDTQWYTLSMVDLAFVTTNTLVTPFAAITPGGFATQNFFPTEFRWPAAPLGPVGAATTLRTRLIFDVSDAEAFRLNLAEVNAGSAGENSASLAYARSQ